MLKSGQHDRAGHEAQICLWEESVGTYALAEVGEGSANVLQQPLNSAYCRLKYQLMWWALVSKGSNSCCTSTTCVTLELAVPQYLVPPSSPFGEIKGHNLCEVLSTVLCTWKY